MNFKFIKEGDEWSLICETTARLLSLSIEQIEDKNDPEMFILVPTLDIAYEEKDLSFMLEVATEMERMNIPPIVCIARRSLCADLTVLFNPLVDSIEFLENAMHPALITNLHNTARGNPIRIFTCVDAEIRGVLFFSFMELFEARKFFALRIIRENLKNPKRPTPLWATMITSYRREIYEDS